MKGSPHLTTVHRRAISPGDRAAGTVTGSGVDCQGFEHLDVTQLFGTFETTEEDPSGGTVYVYLEESDDDSSYSPITGATFGTSGVPLDADVEDSSMRGYLFLPARKRYIRAVAVTAADTAHVGHGTTFELSGSQREPAEATSGLTFKIEN